MSKSTPYSIQRSTRKLRRIDPAPQRETPDLATLQQRLADVVNQEKTRGAALDRFLDIALKLTNATQIVYVTNRNGAMDAEFVAGPDPLPNEARCAELTKWAEAAIDNGKTTLHKTRDDRMTQTIVVPIALSSIQHDAMTVRLILGSEPVEPFVIMLQMIASNIALWYARFAENRLARENRTTAAIVELISKVNDISCDATAPLVIVDELQSFLKADEVALAQVRRGTGKIIAMAGQAEVDHSSEAVTSMQVVVDECLARNEQTRWPAPPNAKHATRAHRQFVEKSRHEAVITQPMMLDEEPKWVLLVAGKHDGILSAANTCFLTAAANYLSEAMRTTIDRRRSDRASSSALLGRKTSDDAAMADRRHTGGRNPLEHPLAVSSWDSMYDSADR